MRTHSTFVRSHLAGLPAVLAIGLVGWSIGCSGSDGGTDPGKSDHEGAPWEDGALHTEYGEGGSARHEQLTLQLEVPAGTPCFTNEGYGGGYFHIGVEMPKDSTSYWINSRVLDLEIEMPWGHEWLTRVPYRRFEDGDTVVQRWELLGIGRQVEDCGGTYTLIAKPTLGPDVVPTLSYTLLQWFVQP